MVWEDFSDQIDQIVVKLKILKLKTTRIDDPVFIFFGQYPTPEQLQSVCNYQDSENIACKRAEAVKTFQLYSHSGQYPSLDSDYFYLVDKIADGPEVGEYGFDQDLQAILTCLALRTDAASDGPLVDKRKERVLEFYRWVAHGRKDHEFQFLTRKPGAPGPSLPTIGSASARAGLDVPPDRPHLNEPRCGGRPEDRRPWFLCTFCKMRNEQEGIIDKIFYCGQNHVDTSVPRPIESLKDIFWLCRMVTIFTDIFDFFEEYACSVDVASIVETKGHLVVQERSLDRHAYLGLPILQQHSTASASAKQWRAVKSELGSADWFYVTHVLLNLLFQPISKRIRKITIQPKNAHKSIQRILPNGKHVFNTLQRHEFLCVTLRSGDEVAFDPAGARYGWEDVLLPMATYTSQRVHFTYYEVDIEPMSAEAFQSRLEEDFRGGSCFEDDIRAARKLHYAKMTEVFLRSQMSWLQGQDDQRTWRFSDMFALPEGEFTKLRKYSVDKVKQWVHVELAKAFGDGVWRLYREESAAVRVAGSLHQASLCEKVWFTEAEYDALKDDEELLHKLWVSRYKKALKEQDGDEKAQDEG